MEAASTSPIVWRLALTSSTEDTFRLLDTDEGRERFWARRSRAGDGGFELEFPGGGKSWVEILECRPPTLMRIHYFGSDAELELTGTAEGGCLFQVTCRCDDPAEWTEFHAGWVSWLLVFKAAADFGVDLRNGSPERAWAERYVDQ